METMKEDVEEYNWREAVLPRLVPVPPELERETGREVVLPRLVPVVPDTAPEFERETGREVVVLRLVPVVPDTAPELELQTGEHRRGRDLGVAVDFGPNSKHVFDWVLAHFARIAATIHLVHAVSS